MRRFVIECHCGNGVLPGVLTSKPGQLIVTNCGMCSNIGCQSPDCGPTISWEIMTPPLWICSVCRRGEHNFHTADRSRCEVSDDLSRSPCACRVIRLERKPFTLGLRDFRSTYAPATPVVGVGPRGLVYRTPFGIQYKNGDVVTGSFETSGVFDMQDNGEVVQPFQVTSDELRGFDNFLRVVTRGSSEHPKLREIATALNHLVKLVGSTVD